MKWWEAILGAAIVLLIREALTAPGRARSPGHEPEDPRAGGIVLCLAGRDSEAMPLLDLAISANPRDALALYFRGRAHAGLGMYRDALSDLVAAARLDPRLRPHLPPVARLALRLGRLASLRLLALAWGALVRMGLMRMWCPKW